jgi:hypothetical protein
MEKTAQGRDALPRQADGEWSPVAFAVHRALEAARMAHYYLFVADVAFLAKWRMTLPMRRPLLHFKRIVPVAGRLDRWRSTRWTGR